MHAKPILAALIAFALSAGSARAAPPAVITYGGFLLDGAGAPVTGPTDLTFRFYDVPTTGTPLSTAETITVDPNAEGYFTAVVGLTVPGFASLFANPVYMGIQAQGDTGEMTPRVQLNSVPSALSVPWSGVTGTPVSSCSATQYANGIGADGRVTCTSLPAVPRSTGWVSFVTADWSLGSGAGSTDFLAPGDVGGQVFFVNGWAGLSGPESANASIAVYVEDCSYTPAPACRGARQVPFTKAVTSGGGTFNGVVEFRYAFSTNPAFAIWLDPVVALKSGTWDSAVGGYIRNTYLPSLKWRMVVVPAPAP